MERTTVDPLDLLNLLYFVVFTIGLALGAFLTILRLIRYWIRDEDAPRLLLRDVIARVTLALPFGGILLIRALGLNPIDHWWGVLWFVASGALAVVGVWIYVYYEVFVIER